MDSVQADRATDKRIIQDRRRKPTPILSRYTLFGRRSSFRRSEDQRRGGYVDRYGPELLCCLHLIAGLNILDAFFTITILQNGGREVNPVIHWAIGCFGEKAWSLKFAVVSCGVTTMCVHSHFRMTRVFIFIAAALYSGIVM